MENQTFQNLKKFMSIVKNIPEWNEQREQAKKFFSKELINQLDGSGYINQVIKLNNS